MDRQETAQVSAKKSDSVENVLLKLAKKQGMNTDIRRSIFVVLMSSEVCHLLSIPAFAVINRECRIMLMLASGYLS